jgi:hypothetical protein
MISTGTASLPNISLDLVFSGFGVLSCEQSGNCYLSSSATFLRFTAIRSSNDTPSNLHSLKTSTMVAIEDILGIISDRHYQGTLSTNSSAERPRLRYSSN